MANEIETRAQLFAKYLGAELKGAIRSRGYSQAEIADRLGHARSSFANWLNAKPSIPVEVAEKICLCIGVDMKVIVGRAHERVNEDMGCTGTVRATDATPQWNNCVASPDGNHGTTTTPPHTATATSSGRWKRRSTDWRREPKGRI